MKLPGLHWPHLHLPKLRHHQRPERHQLVMILRGPRFAALLAIAVLVGAASLTSFAESYRALWFWAVHHDVPGQWSYVWPLMVDSFIAVGELALFVALVDRWDTRSRYAAWTVVALGLAVSVAGNIGHLPGHPDMWSRATAAVPPLAAAASLAVGLGVLKRVVEHHQAAPRPAASTVPSDVLEAARASMRATVAAGNPLSVNQLAERFSLPRAMATKTRTEALAEANGTGGQ